MHINESSHGHFHDIPNPFERRQFAFRVLPEDKDPMSNAKHYSYILPTLKVRLQQLITTRLWEYFMFILSIWSIISLFIVHIIPEIRLFLELTHEIAQGSQHDSFLKIIHTYLIFLAALFIEVFFKLYADSRWFFYDIWNLYDLVCVILNSPFIYNLFLSDYLGVPHINSIQRLFRILHAIRIIRIHNLLRFVIETLLTAVSSICNILLLEFVIVTVFALISIAFEGDTPSTDSNTYKPYANYTEALYSYYMSITLEGVNEVAEQILELDSPKFTTVIGLVFYIFAALVTYTVGQLLAAVIATTLSKAIDRLNHEKTSKSTKNHTPRLLGLQHPKRNRKNIAKSRCNTIDEIQNFSRLKSDDLVLLILLYQTLDKNVNEYKNIVRDIRHISESISRFNNKEISQLDL